MSRLILHIGTHKTGTTAVQNAFFARRRALAAHGIVYPKLGRMAGHHGLVAKWIPVAERYRYRVPVDHILEDLAHTHARSDRTVILSAEEFSRGDPVARVDMAELNRFVRRFDTCTVLCCLRHQVDYMQSIFLEAAKRRVPLPPAELVARAEGLVDGLWPDYTKLRDRLLTVFAPEELVFVDYTTARRHPQGVPGALCTAAGLAQAAPLMAGGAARRVNPSGEPLAVWAAQVITRPAPMTRPALAAARAVLTMQHPGATGSCIFTRQEVATLLDRFHARNATLAPHFPTAPHRLSPPQHDPDTTIFREDIDTEFWVGLARLAWGARP